MSLGVVLDFYEGPGGSVGPGHDREIFTLQETELKQKFPTNLVKRKFSIKLVLKQKKMYDTSNMKPYFDLAT